MNIGLCIPCNPKKENKCPHNRKKYYCIDCNGKGICEHKKRKESCNNCKGAQICIHEKLKYHCIDCSGCEHKKIKQNCVDCNGSQICIHKKRKSRCKECKGSDICIHGIIKQGCKTCNGSAFCLHGNRKNYCRECNGSQICIHNKLKNYCHDCFGSSMCEHNKQKRRCSDCNGKQLCEHKKDKYYCKECKGNGICEHNKQKNFCKDCKGSFLCIHNKNKRYCKVCDGSKLCKNEWCETSGNILKYEGYCMPCFVNNPENRDKPAMRNYKTKEKDVVDNITKTFTNFTWVADKKVQDGCSRRRPDLLLDMGSHIIIVEIDENKHTEYDCSCENKRLMELSQDLQHRPIIFIRFNPDSYINQDGILIKSCWKLNRLGVMQVIKTKQIEWEERISILKDQIQYWIDNPTEKIIEIIQLYY
jgi:hypothetical protein